MTAQIAELLDRLAAAEPEVCRLRDDGRYVMQDYVFWFGGDQLGAQELKYDNAFLSPFTFGQAALDWLQGALQRAIEARGWEYQCQSFTNSNGAGRVCCANIIDFDFSYADTPAAALLAAFVAAVEAATNLVSERKESG